MIKFWQHAHPSCRVLKICQLLMMHAYAYAIQYHTMLMHHICIHDSGSIPEASLVSKCAALTGMHVKIKSRACKLWICHLTP